MLLKTAGLAAGLLASWAVWQAQLTDYALDWIERLGGWAVVLIVVRWMMTRIDALIDGMKGSVASFQQFEREEHETHKAILTRLASSDTHLLDIARNQERICELLRKHTDR